MKPVYLLVGVPGSGKTWICNQLSNFTHVPHDAYIGQDYIAALKTAAKKSDKPVLAETPFSVSQIMHPLLEAGITVKPYFIHEPEAVLKARYTAREGRPIPLGHLSRQFTYMDRATILGAPIGTAHQILQLLKAVT